MAMIILPESVSAAGFRLPNQSAFATARGNAFVATANNASAVYYNPAGIAQHDGQEIELGLYSINFSVDANKAGGSFSNNDEIQFVPQAFYTNASESWSWGIGLYAPFGLGNEWPENTDFTSITTSAEITYLSLSPVIAKELMPNLSLGFGLTINYVDAELEQGIGLVPGDRFNYSGNDYGLGFVIGVLWDSEGSHRIGANYRSGVTHNLSGNSRVSFIPTSSNSDLEIEIPATFTVGYAYQPNETWDFEMNIEWGDWSKLDQVVITNSPLGVNVPIDFAWEDGLIYQFGATRKFDSYALSFGYDYNEGIQSDDFYTPAISDANRHWFNIGVSKLETNNPWTIAYQYGTSSRKVVNANANPVTHESGNGDYDVRVHSLSFSFGFSF